MRRFMDVVRWGAKAEGVKRRKVSRRSRPILLFKETWYRLVQSRVAIAHSPPLPWASS